MSDLTDRLKAEGRRLGFDAVGVAPAVAPPGYAHFLEWLDAGHAAGMAYLERGAPARSHPSSVFADVRSVIMASVVYGRPSPEPTGPGRGKIARYARGGDYHEFLWRRLEQLLGWLQTEHPGLRGRVVADTAPLLERDFARLVGLGWFGKNTLLIDRKLGSFTVLGALLVDAELPCDHPIPVDHCGTCTRCLDACPTSAFAGPRQLDSRKCISYWTIEHKGPIPEAIDLHGWAFGCDICQDVCPWNRKAPPGLNPELAPRTEWEAPDLIGWLTRDPAEFKRSLKGTALARSKRAGLLRNAALVLGSRRQAEAVPALAARLADPNEDPTVRGAAAWALGRIGTPAAIRALDADRATCGLRP